MKSVARVATALVLLTAAALGASAAPASTTGKPALRVLERSGLVVRGANFHSTERVTLRASGIRRVVHTTAAGAFRVDLGGSPTDRCSFSISAVGAVGDHARARVLPSRAMCAPAKSP